jgi:hypothetical protein
MSNPPTLYKHGNNKIDLSEFFLPGSSSIVTGYKLPGNADLGTIFADISGATGLGYPVGFKINDYNGDTGITKDLSDLFAVNPVNYFSTLTISGTHNTEQNSGYSITYFKSGSASITISGLKARTFHYCVVGGGGAGGYDQGGGGGSGGVLQGSFTIYCNVTINIVVGRGGTITSNIPSNGGTSLLLYNSVKISAKGGGAGGCGVNTPGGFRNPGNGGSGGGAAYNGTVVGLGTPGQGHNGGGGAAKGGGGGGGPLGPGFASVQLSGAGNAGNGGEGIKCIQDGIKLNNPNTRWGGGGGGGQVTAPNYNAGQGGADGGGFGASIVQPRIAAAGQPDSGGGGGGGRNSNVGAAGGGGIVTIAYLTNP